MVISALPYPGPGHMEPPVAAIQPYPIYEVNQGESHKLQCWELNELHIISFQTYKNTSRPYNHFQLLLKKMETMEE